MNEPRWLDARIALDVHDEQLSIFGGRGGVRDPGLLASALDRPRNKFAYGDEDIVALAAAYAFGLSRNHPFVDGNKRTAFTAIIVFLGLNGVAFRPSLTDATAAMLALAAGELDEEGLTRWIRDNVRA